MMRNQVHRIMPVILLIVLISLGFFGCVSTGIAVSASYGKLQDEDRGDFIVRYYDIDSGEAKRITETIVSAMDFLRKNLADVRLKKFTVYVYHTQEDMARGLVVYSRFSTESAQRFSRSGAPRPLSGVFHVPITLNLQTIAHETTHMYIEAISGNAYQRIKWLDEGMAEYQGYLFWRQKNPDARAGKMIEYNAFLAQNKGRFFTLDRLCAEIQWSALNTGSTASLIYRQAFFTVAMLAKQYGIEKLKQTLFAVRDGMASETACRSVLSRRHEEISDEVMKLEDLSGLL